MWRDGLSYEKWIAGGYHDPVGCWPAPLPLKPIKVNQRQNVSWKYPLTPRLEQSQSLQLSGGRGVRSGQLQGLRLYPALGGGHQLQSLRLNPIVGLSVNQLQSLGMSPTSGAEAGQLQSLRLNPVVGAEAGQLQSLGLVGGAEGSLSANQLQSLALVGGAEGSLSANQLQSLTMAPQQPAEGNQLQSLSMAPQQPAPVNQLQSLTMVGSAPLVYPGNVFSGFSTLFLMTLPPPTIPTGYHITGPGVASGATVTGQSGNQIFMSAAATSSASGNYTFAP